MTANEDKTDGGPRRLTLRFQYLPVTATKDTVRQLLASVGCTPLKVSVPPLGSGQRGRQAFADVPSAEAERVASELNQTSLEGMTLKVAVSTPVLPVTDVTLLVRGLPYRATADELRELFITRDVAIIAARIAMHPSGRSKGYGFVKVAKEDADKALRALDGVSLDRRPLSVAFFVDV